MGLFPYQGLRNRTLRRHGVKPGNLMVMIDALVESVFQIGRQSQSRDVCVVSGYGNAS